MVGELHVPVIAAGGAALMAIDDFQLIPMKAWLIRPEPFDELGDVKNCAALAAEAVDRQACACGQFAAERGF